LPDVVVDAEPAKSTLQPARSAAQGSILPPEAADDRTCSRQKPVDVLRDHSVVHARRLKPVPGCEQQREPTPHAEADHADAAGAVVTTGQPAAHGVDALEGATPPGQEIPEGRLEADRPP